MSGTFENAQKKEPAYHFFKVAIQFKLTRQYSRADIIAADPAVRLNVSNIIAFHLIAARFGARTLAATQRRAVHSMKTFFVNNSSHLHSARMFKIFSKTIAGYSPPVLYYPYEGTKGVNPMMYPFLTLDDQTEIVHSEVQSDGSVKVYIEKPDAKDGFHSAYCHLPDYKWYNVSGFSQEEIARYQSVIESTAHLIMQFSKDGGLLKPAIYENLE